MLANRFEPKTPLIPEGISSVLDSVGVLVSWLCVVHCLFIPFAIALLPFTGLVFLLDETAEWAIVATSIALATASLLPAFLRAHGSFRPVMYFVSGLGLLLSARLIFEGDLIAEGLLLLAGAGLITASHLINRRLCEQCSSCSEEASVEG